MNEQIIILLAGKLHILLAGIAVLYFLGTSLRRKVALAVFGAVALPTSFVVGKVLGAVIQTQRPFVTLDIQPLVAHAADNGFPSEHTLYALVIAGVVWLVHKKLGSFLVVLAAMVGVGRVLAFVHNPVDILGSAVIAIVIIYAMHWAPVRSYLHSIQQYVLVKIKKEDTDTL